MLLLTTFRQTTNWCFFITRPTPVQLTITVVWPMLGSAQVPPEPDTAPGQPYQPATEASAEAAAPLLPGSLCLGDYIVGETNCPALYGHPDIRY